ncbi:MAG: MarR family winged helix-turn-helix transcriptional regulator [Planctomycetota bacterium]|nr:MarR family winged helix-turn-helix transcriptional regulator [Planctomycetota bacterium]
MGAHVNSAASDDARLVMDSIRRIVRALRLFDRQAERSVRLSGAQVFVLQKLRDGEPVSINELAERTHTHQSSVSVVVQKLVNQKLIRRAQAATDARRVELSLTAKGRALLKSAPAAAQDRLIAAIQQLNAPHRSQLARRLAELTQKMGIEDQQPSLFFEDGLRRKGRSLRGNLKSEG